MIAAGDLWYTCAACEYKGHRVAHIVTREVSEAWGVRRVDVERTPICPECGSQRLDCQPVSDKLGACLSDS